MKPVYTHPQQTWTAAECAKRAKSAPADHWGNRPPKGLINSSSAVHPGPGQTTRWNGGFIAPDGEHYESECVPLPIIPDTFEFVNVPSWGTRIQKKAVDNVSN